MNNIAKYLVEFIGTAIFLYVIIGTGNWLAIGLTLGIVILIGGPISGGNFNPAVTGMLVAAKKMPTNTIKTANKPPKNRKVADKKTPKSRQETAK